jgi:carboxymethylenebutenolidase
LDRVAVLPHEGTYSIMYGQVPLPFGTGHRTGYLARPDEAGTFPVVVVVPGLSGLSSAEKDVCRRLARSGITGLSFAPYPADDDPLAAYNELPDSAALADLDEVYEYVDSEDVTWNAGDKLGLLGIDVGGRFALVKASDAPWVGSVAVCYTPLTGDEEREIPVADRLAYLPVPVMGLYGSADELIDPGTVDEAQSRNAHGQWLLYDGAGHGFLDPEAPEFDQGASDDAMARLIAFFRATLPTASVEELG